MKKALLLLLVFAFSAAAENLSAGEKVDRSLKVDATGAVEISTIRGRVDIQAWNEASVKVTGTLDDFTKKFTFDVAGKNTVIKVELDDSKSFSGGQETELIIRVPASARVIAGGVSTDMTVKGVAGRLEVSSVSGDLAVDEAGERVRAKSVSGDIRISGSGGVTNAGSVSGDLVIRVSRGEVIAKSVSGDITVVASSLGEVEISTVSGDVVVQGGEMAGDVKVASVSGDLSLKLPAQMDARFIVASGFGGEIRNEYSDDTPTERSLNRESLEFTRGEGAQRINLSTMAGTIVLSGQ